MEVIITSKAKNDLYGFFFKSKGNTSNNVLKYIGEVVEYIVHSARKFSLKRNLNLKYYPEI